MDRYALQMKSSRKSIAAVVGVKVRNDGYCAGFSVQRAGRLPAGVELHGGCARSAGPCGSG